MDDFHFISTMYIVIYIKSNQYLIRFGVANCINKPMASKQYYVWETVKDAKGKKYGEVNFRFFFFLY